MNNKDAMRRFISGLIIIALLLGGGGLALAATTGTSINAQTNSVALVYGSKLPGGARAMGSDTLQSVLDSLVAANTITQNQADQIMTAAKQLLTDHQNLKGQIGDMKEKLKSMTQDERKAYLEQNRPERVDIFTQLINEGTITQEQADEVIKAFQDKMAAQRQEQLKTALNGLVEKNVINDDQVTAILNQLTEFQIEHQAQMDATKDMTRAQRQAYFQTNLPTQVSPLAELVTAGIITQAQADEITKVIPGGGGRNMGMHQERSQGGKWGINAGQTV
ncbi:MAG: hypothetical protein VB084_10905 [Syntrophomonadaceae bacterium]|nr:hypothetical protein [Syntrophomonadaceae bacterium]